MPTAAPWPRHPILYEVNAFPWLREVSARAGKALTLETVPAAEWDALAAWKPDAVWLMGVWERSPEGRRIALADEKNLRDFRAALPDLDVDADVPGSAYCVRRYAADPRLGGPAGLAKARAELARRGIKLVLDLVPNHVAPDHPWAREAPQYFVRGTAEEAERSPGAFRRIGANVYACGRDPYFPPWQDVLQLDAFSRGYRAALAETIVEIAGQCDAVRTDMAMLLVNRVFARTWGDRVGPPPATELWREVLADVKRRRPGFLFLAEAYWEMEWELQQLGFDFCYDKRLYDRMVAGSGDGVAQHVSAGLEYQEKLVRFTENHDEPRAAHELGARSRAAAVAVATLPGARLFHEGQFEGRRVRLPVFLGRRPAEPVEPGFPEFYRKLLAEAGRPVYRDGAFATCELRGWSDNGTYRNLAAWCWRLGEERRLVVVNLGSARSQALVRLPWRDVGDRIWRLEEALGGTAFDRSGADMVGPGLFVELEPGAWHLLALR